ncbi:oxidoreductase-like protein, partial [Aureobasidium melanogenum]|uniref:Oxidoreductase-like protein n=2 Tax=Aureobasidium melanogenum TaxID=46634 RepID=A0A074VXV4_AURM1
MALVHVLDNYYLAISFLICLGYQAIFFAISVGFKTDQLNDVAGGTNFVLLAIITVSMYGQHEARQIVDSIFIMIWGARLAGFLLFRIIKTGKDDRFDDKRGKFLPMLGFYTFQTLWVWTVSMPVTVLNSPIVNQYPQPAFNKATDILAVIGFGIGIIMETVSDIQKYRFKQNHKERGAVCNVGFFAWSRHPNYFAEILIQFSIYMLAVTPASYNYVHGGAKAALFSSVVGPVFLTTLLMFVSGLTLQERPGAKKRYEKGEGWNEYAAYLHQTSILIPFPPALYKRMPVILKRTLFLEFPIYVFDPAKHADQDAAQRHAEEGHN